ncbi:MAG: LuxR C-terminal-related transcriptional regulator [Flavobacteriaceae bacterium]
MINLLLIDPHPVVRCGFENFLSEYNFLNVVHTAENLADGKRNIEIAERLKINQKTVNTYKTG